MSILEQALDDAQQRSLRGSGVITESEVAIKIGDLYVAQNIVTSERRPITIHVPMTEQKQVLRG
jgi:hypothetical protein